MMRCVLLFMVLLSGVHPLAAQQHVEARGITSAIKLEEIIFGHLAELNGNSQVRAIRGDVCPRRLPGSASPRWSGHSLCVGIRRARSPSRKEVSR